MSILIKVRLDGVETLYDCESIVIDRDKGETTLTCYDRVHAAYVDIYLETGETAAPAPPANAAVAAPPEETPAPARGGKKAAAKNPLMEDAE